MSDFDLTPPGKPASASPIADLSYRNYDGPLHTRAVRWWIVAVANIRIMLRKPGFWILTLLAALPYVQSLLILQFGGGGNLFGTSDPAHKYALQFYQSLQAQQFFVFLLALMVGAGCIAADNRANALLVYLSKPITKGDYLLGKWMGVFLILFGVGVVPSLILFVYCLLSFSGDGFLTNEPTLFWRMLVANTIPAAVHASLLVGFSAWSKTPRIAGAVYAAFCLISSAIAGIIGSMEFRAHADPSRLIQSLSVFGGIQGLAQNVYGVTLQIGKFHRRSGGFEQIKLAPPSLWVMLALVTVFIVLGIAAARMKIKAVEVVRG